MAEKPPTAKAVVDNPEMGLRARARRIELDLSVLDLAQILEVGTGRITQMELHGAEGLSTIRRWANALGMAPQELAFGTPAEVKKGKKRS